MSCTSGLLTSQYFKTYFQIILRICSNQGCHFWHFGCFLNPKIILFITIDYIATCNEGLHLCLFLVLPHLFQLAYQLCLRLAFSCFPGGQVAKLFQDSSLGNAVNIVVTRLILLMEDQVSEPLDVVTLVGLVT